MYDGLTTSGSMLEALGVRLLQTLRQIPSPDQVEARLAEQRRKLAARKAAPRIVETTARPAVSKRPALGKGVELKRALMPIITAESKRLIEVRTPPHPSAPLRTPPHPSAPLRAPSAPPPHLSRNPTAPSTPVPPPQAAWRNPTRAPAILLPGVRTLATWGTWRLSGLTGVGDRRGIMDSVLCQAAYTVSVVRAQARVELPVRAPAPHPLPRPRLAPRTRTRTRTRLPPRSELTLRLSAQLDPDECPEDSECRAVLDGGCLVPEESDESR